MVIPARRPFERLTRDHLAWAIFCIVAGLLFLIYSFVSLAAGRGQFLLPLDDVYIHFQYARQLASGQPFVYNPGQPPTSGATSFLYPFILAAGYGLGFQGLNLGLWAMGVGAAALALSGWLIYRLVKVMSQREWLALGGGLVFALSGSINWHFFSGMETGLMLLFSLATLYVLLHDRLRLFAACASLLALTRPEGGILAGLAVGALFISMRGLCAASWRTRGWIVFLPLLAVSVQPLVNGFTTGSIVASGSAAKSIFSAVPFYWDETLGRIFANAARMVVEFITGYSAHGGWYLPFPLGLLALIGIVLMLLQREKRWIIILLLAWIAAGTAAIATLDTAFWHFKRYQMPLMALLLPLAAWGIERLLAMVEGIKSSGNTTQNANATTAVSWGLKAILFVMLLLAASTGATFMRSFALNVDYVYRQPYQMARWLRQNAPENALVAVHDVGLMRYLGGRTTLDMVGLTTPGAALYWRSGPGALAELLIRSRPDYIASYGHGHGYGLGMLADTSLYGEPLALFSVRLDPQFNVALAADTQGIYQPDWPVLAWQDLDSSAQVINVADLASEHRARYEWLDQIRQPGFATYVEELAIPGCTEGRCTQVVAGRRINGEESFTVETEPGVAVTLTTYLHAFQRATFDVYVDDVLVDRNWIPEMPGYVVFVPTFVPGEFISGNRARIRIVPSGDYFPAFHLITQAGAPSQPFVGQPIASYQDGAILLTHVALDAGQITLDWYTDGRAQGDYKLFVHILDTSDRIVAQADVYPGDNSLPPGNWLPGPRRDRVVVNLTDAPPGGYRAALGLYDPYSNERLTPESERYEISDGRLIIGTIQVE